MSDRSMSWSYGAVENHDGTFSCHEIFHTPDGKLWTIDPVTFDADSLLGLVDELRMALADVEAAGSDPKRLVSLDEQEVPE